MSPMASGSELATPQLWADALDALLFEQSGFIVHVLSKLLKLYLTRSGRLPIADCSFDDMNAFSWQAAMPYCSRSRSVSLELDTIHNLSPILNALSKGRGRRISKDLLPTVGAMARAMRERRP